jgi:hypothetical protein
MQMKTDQQIVTSAIVAFTSADFPWRGRRGGEFSTGEDHYWA